MLTPNITPLRPIATVKVSITDGFCYVRQLHLF